MSSSAKMRKLSVRIDADLKASFEGTLRGIGVDPTCAMRSFAFQIVLEGDIPFGPVDTGFEASGKTAVTSVKIPDDVAGEMESVLKGLGTNFSQAVRLLALQTTALGRDAVRLRHPPRGEMRGSGFPEDPGRLFSARRPTRFGTPRRAGRWCGRHASIPFAETETKLCMKRMAATGGAATSRPQARQGIIQNIERK